MATRTFLDSEQLSQARQVLLPPIAKPTGQVHLDHSLTTALDFSSWLALMVENRLREVPGWDQAGPIAIGSWGRGELCPGSDLDVIFCGDLKAVQKVVRFVEDLGMKFRYRVPEDPEDWTKNVEALEVNALFWGKAFTQEGAEKLQAQKNKILQNKNKFRRSLLKAITQERRVRFKRYDSVANFLEPNLKFGAGGLRDLHQGLILAHWYPERFEAEEHAFKVLDYYRCFFLLIRQKLHLTNFHDILTAADQHDMTGWLGYESNRQFMVEVQKGLSRVSFHSDWIIERCQLSQKDLQFFRELKVNSWTEALNLLEKDSRLQAQSIVRESLYQSQGFHHEKVAARLKGTIAKKILDIKQKDETTVAAFRSQMVSHLIPSFTKIIGLVQHDQYHRLTVDAHLLQAVREVKRLFEKPGRLGKLLFYAEKLSPKDWNILRWAALYHDIAKGQGGDHSEKGKEIATMDLKSFGLPKDMIDEVVWLVDHHLILSNAAFRKNPQSPQTWQDLYSRGVRGDRLYRLAIFTVIDIIATNPEAWNSWKENLLSELVETLRNPSRESHYDFAEKVRKRGVQVPQSFLDQLDVAVVENIPQARLIKDFKEILKGEELKPLVLKDKKNRTWVRFHKAKDEKGLVLGFTQRLTKSGCNIRQAYIHTDEVMGVYDWFCVKNSRSQSLLKKSLLHNNSEALQGHCLFSRIDLVSAEETEWVFSFRAKDKKGLLLSAIQALYRNDLEIIWAKVHTWGRQIDDVFGVVPKFGESPEQILKNLKSDWESAEFEIL